MNNFKMRRNNYFKFGTGTFIMKLFRKTNVLVHAH